MEPPPHPHENEARTEPWHPNHKMFYVICLDCGCGTMPVPADMAETAVKRWNKAAIAAEVIAALDGFRHHSYPDPCFCGVALGNPMLGGRHTKACAVAVKLLARLEAKS